MSRGNIIRMVLGSGGLHVCFQAAKGPITYVYSGAAATGILAGDDPHEYESDSSYEGLPDVDESAGGLIGLAGLLE